MKSTTTILILIFTAFLFLSQTILISTTEIKSKTSNNSSTSISPQTKKNLEAISKIKDKILNDNMSLIANQKNLEKFITQKKMDFTEEGFKAQKAVFKKAIAYWRKKAKQKKNKKEGDAFFSNQTKEEMEKGHKELIEILKKLHHMRIINNNSSMLEMAAGTGRLTKHVFSKLDFIKSIDFLEPESKLKKTLKKVKKSIPKVKDIYISGAENFTFKKKYDIIMGEYLLENIPDIKLLEFLINARKSLKKNGKLIFGENVNTEGTPIDTDAPLMHQRIRTDHILNFYFKMCGLTVTSNFGISENLWKNRDDYYFNLYVLKRDSDI